MSGRETVMKLASGTICENKIIKKLPERNSWSDRQSKRQYWNERSFFKYGFNKFSFAYQLLRLAQMQLSGKDYRKNIFFFSSLDFRYWNYSEWKYFAKTNPKSWSKKIKKGT